MLEKQSFSAPTKVGKNKNYFFFPVCDRNLIPNSKKTNVHQFSVQNAHQPKSWPRYKTPIIKATNPHHVGHLCIVSPRLF